MRAGGSKIHHNCAINNISLAFIGSDSMYRMGAIAFGDRQKEGYYARLLIYTLAALSVAGIAGHILAGNRQLVDGIFLFEFFRAQYFLAIIVLGLWYLLLKIFFAATHRENAVAVATRGILTLLTLCLFSFAMIVTTNLIFATADFTRFAAVTAKIAALEASLSGGYPPSLLLPGLLSFIPGAEAFIYLSYLYTLYVLSLTLIFLVVVSPLEARRYLVSVIVVFLLAAPVWIFVPVGWPQAYYLDNTLNGTFTAVEAEAIAQFHGKAHSPPIEKALREFPSVWRFDRDGALPVSGFPSMHAAWAVLIMYFARKIGWWFCMPAAMVAGASLLGTIYLLQHFLIDLAGGVAIALIAIALVRRLPIAVGKRDPFWLFDEVHKDARNFLHQLQRDWGNIGRHFS